VKERRLLRPTRATFALLALVVAASALPLRAQFWAKQTYENWSRRDCEKMLNDSPWAKSRIVGRVFIQRAEEQAAVPGREQSPQIAYVVRLLSARTVRQAMVRVVRLDRSYAKLTPEEKQELDARHKSLLERSFADRIVFQIEYTTNALAYRSELVSHWQSRSEEELKQEIYLITPRGRIPAARVFVAGGAGGEIQVIFSRMADGHPVIQLTDKTFALEFQHPTVGVLAAERVFIEFKVKNMLVKNELIF